jgi:hypothetical protein
VSCAAEATVRADKQKSEIRGKRRPPILRELCWKLGDGVKKAA